jgi:hypothetical protein
MSHEDIDFENRFQSRSGPIPLRAFSLASPAAAVIEIGTG